MTSSCSLQLVAELKGHSDRVWQATWSPDGKILATCSGDKTVRFWQKDSQTNAYNCIDILKGSHTRTVRSIDWSPDGNYLACASFDGTTSIWERRKENEDMQEDEEQEGNSSNLFLFVTSLEGHENEVKSVSWDQEGLLLATCGRDKSVWIWENVDGEHFECMSVLQGHTQDVKMVKFHPTQNVLASASYDDTIKIWKGEVDDFILAESLIGHKSTVWSISFNSDGSKLASAGDDKALVIWSASEKQGGKEEEKSIWKDIQKITGVHTRTIYSVDWSHTSNLIATGAADDHIRIFGPKAGSQEFELKFSLPKAHATDVNCVRWNPTEEGILVSTSDEPTVKVWQFKQ